MVTISVEIPDELAERLTPVQSRLAEIIELGLLQLHNAESKPLTSRKVIEKIWADAGLTKSLDPSIKWEISGSKKRQAPLNTAGKPASQIIIEQRGPL